MADSTVTVRNECGKILIWPNNNFSLICKFCGDDFDTLEYFRVHYTTEHLAHHFPEPPLIIKCETTVGTNCEAFPYDLADSVTVSETLTNIKNEDSVSCSSESESIRTEIHDENSSLSGLVVNQFNENTIKCEQMNEIQLKSPNASPVISDNPSVLPKSRKRGCEFSDRQSSNKKSHSRSFLKSESLNHEYSSDSSGEESNAPLELRSNDRLLPETSREKYNGAYQTFMNWRKSNSVTIVSENVLLSYFVELSEKLKPSSLWSIYSMLKCTLKFHENLDIGIHLKLTAFLKKTSKGYKGKKSKVLSSENVEKFLSEAPDETYLVMKVALIFGISGACRREELPNIKLQDIEHQGNIMLVKIPNNKTKIPRTFIVDGKFRNIVAKYEALRPKNVQSDRFFLNFQKGKCTLQVIGKNKFGKMPGDIAKYLNLPDAVLYTGHSFRRTSATLLADSGAGVQTLQRHGGWKSCAVARAYITDSINSKKQIGTQIASTITLASPTPKKPIRTY